MGSTVIGILAHVDAGKTTLSESLLYLSGATRKFGRVDNQDAFLDTYELEKKRGITIFSKMARMKLAGRDVILLDTPGHVDFSAEMERTLQVLDYAILVISGSDGVQGHTRTLWRLLRQYDIPAFLFINKMDQPGTNREELMKELCRTLDDTCIDFTPFEELPGVKEESGSEAAKTDADADAPAPVLTGDFAESIAVCDEEVMDYYLEHDEVTLEQAAELVVHRKIFPCFFGSALKLTGIPEFIASLGKILREKKYPHKFGARVYKITRDNAGRRLTFLKVTGGEMKVRSLLGEEKINEIRLYSGAKYETADTAAAGEIAAVTGPVQSYAGQGFGCDKKGMRPLTEPVLTYRLQLPEESDVHKALGQLRELEEEDPQLHIVWDGRYSEIQIQLMGEVQTQVLTQLIKERYGMDVSFSDGRILYKETIKDPVEGVGHFEPLRHYAEVHLRLEPGEPGSGLSFASECSVNQLDRNWQRLILTHLREKTHRGVLTGSPITDMRIILIAGRASTKHTEGGDFRQATYRALRQGLMKARSEILEPFYDFRLELPSEQIGRAMSDIERFSGNFQLEESTGDAGVLTGRAPVSEMQGYQAEVTSYTGGKGRLMCTLAGYFPCHNPAQVWEQFSYDPESDLENTPDSVFCSHGAGFVVPWYVTEKYMHLPGAGLPDYSGMTGLDLDWYDEVSQDEESAAPKKRERISEYVGEDELKAIFERTYGPIKSKLHDTSVTIRAPQKEYVWKEKPKKKKNGDFLLVDGYNVIFSWDELRELAGHDMAAARDTLMDILSDYQGLTGKYVILVFDAYKVADSPGSEEKWNNIHLVFTRHAETADQYIEKTAHVMAKNSNVTVVTSDGTEQVIIRSEGCLLLSSRDFREEIVRMRQTLRTEHLEKHTRGGNYLGDYISQDMRKEVKDSGEN